MVDDGQVKKTSPANEAHEKKAILIDVSSVPRSQDGKARRLMFEARVDGRLICVSDTPFLDTARALLKEGVDPGTQITLIRNGRECMTSTVGRAGSLTIEESGTPKFRKWSPNPMWAKKTEG